MPNNKDKKPVGRPGVAPEDKQKARNIKMSDYEWGIVQDMAKQAGISAAEYIRRKVFGG
jgi:hypothetical protein